MLERIVLAVIVTVCICSFLNVSQKSSSSSIIEAKPELIPELMHRVASFSF